MTITLLKEPLFKVKFNGMIFLQHQHLISSFSVIGACDYQSVYPCHHLLNRG